MIQGQYEKVRVIVAFADITGFTKFWDSITNDETELKPFLESLDAITDESEREIGNHLTDTGDGDLLTVDLPAGETGSTAAKILLCLWNLLKKKERLIAEKEPPRPDGFRIAVSCGYIWRKMKKDRRILNRGKPLNQAHNLLEVARGVGMVCDDIFKQLMSEKQAKDHGFVFTSIKPGVWIVTVKRHPRRKS